MVVRVALARESSELPRGIDSDLIRLYESIRRRYYPWSRAIGIEEVRSWLRELDLYSDFALATCYVGSRLVGAAWLLPSRVTLEVDDAGNRWCECVERLLAIARWLSRSLGYSGRVLISVGLEFDALASYVANLVKGVPRVSVVCMGIDDPSSRRFEYSPSGIEVALFRDLDEASRALGGFD